MQQNSPRFIMNINFGEGSASVGFMSKDASINESSYLLGRTICKFFKDATNNEQDFLRAINNFLLGMEDQTEWTPMNSVASKEEQAKAVKKCCGWKKNCCWQKKKTSTKKPVNKKK